MSDENIFGGKNPNAIYTPMTETEQEVIQRLIEDKDLKVYIYEWGEINDPTSYPHKVYFGDKNLVLELMIAFDRPEGVTFLVDHLDLYLTTRDDQLLSKVRKNFHKPLPVTAGTSVKMTWVIAIHMIKSGFVKRIKPGAKGLTTREGNRKLTEVEARTLHLVREGEKKVRNMDL